MVGRHLYRGRHDLGFTIGERDIGHCQPGGIDLIDRVRDRRRAKHRRRRHAAARGERHGRHGNGSDPQPAQPHGGRSRRSVT
jgi:hypothetical protein